jgi:hypothetical protein
MVPGASTVHSLITVVKCNCASLVSGGRDKEGNRSSQHVMNGRRTDWICCQLLGHRQFLDLDCDYDSWASRAGNGSPVE